MYILVVNAGSSSLKYQLYDKQTQAVLARGLCEKIGNDDSFHKYEIIGADESTAGDETLVELKLNNHHDAIKVVLDTITADQYRLMSNLDEIVAIGHRVVHGGEYFSASVVIDDEVIGRIEECVPLAPLHNPPSLTGIKACFELMPNATQVAVFDTAFHQTIAPQAFMYALPYEMYDQHRIRKYGFHGTSHRFVASQAANFLGQELASLKMVTCHLGNGGSLTAVKSGISVDTSMGFTPLDGLMMGTRCGSIDPAIVVYMIEKLGMSVAEVENIMNRKSGILGISGRSNDLRDVGAGYDEGDKRSILAIEMYANYVRRYLGQYAFEMGGLDAVVFCGGVGENDVRMRELILDGLDDMGIILDKARNATRGGERLISADESAVKVMVVPTNEELMIAQDVIGLLK